jgi:ABC-type nitrate/sulfonate/bicarbonate transport system permease component
LRKKFRSTTAPRRWPPFLLAAALVLLWQGVSASGLLPAFLLPGPVRVVLAFAGDFPLLMRHLGVTLLEAACGLALSVAAAFVLATLMDNSAFLRQSVTPVLLFTQTIPTVAIAPLLVLWMGYGAAPKITLIFLTCFFPMTIGLLGGFAQADVDAIRLLQSMGAGRRQIYRYIKLPSAMPAFVSGLKISTTYSIVGAVISEWLGGAAGLGVYMTRVRKSYSFDKMFAVILLVSALSVALVTLTTHLARRLMPWDRSSHSSS